jgi:UDP-N-acetylglucosamine 2-epimerase (non-hydrolysing)
VSQHAAIGPAKVLIVFGTRPEAIKLLPVIAALRADPRFVPIVCVSAQHRALLDQVLGIAGIVPDYDLNLMRADQTLDGLTALLLTRLGEVMDAQRPARVIVQGDTATAMAGALAAYYRKIPVDHVEAGLRSGNIHHPWPEEVNRKIISAIASLHFAPTPGAQAALLAETIPAGRIRVTGNTVIDALHWVQARIAAEPALVAGLAELIAGFAGKRIIAVTCHRRENFGAGLDGIVAALRQIAARNDVAMIVPVHPNPNVRKVMDRGLAGLANVRLIAPLDYPNFTHLLACAYLVLTDSGGVQEEAPALGKPVLVLRETTERPEGIAAGTARLVGADPQRIVEEACRLLDVSAAYAAMAQAHNPFGDGQAAARIVAGIAAEL